MDSRIASVSGVAARTVPAPICRRVHSRLDVPEQARERSGIHNNGRRNNLLQELYLRVSTVLCMSRLSNTLLMNCGSLSCMTTKTSAAHWRMPSALPRHGQSGPQERGPSRDQSSRFDRSTYFNKLLRFHTHLTIRALGRIILRKRLPFSGLYRRLMRLRSTTIWSHHNCSRQKQN